MVCTTVIGYTVSLDHRMDLGDLIALGAYETVDPDITAKNFPPELFGNTQKRPPFIHEVELSLVHFDASFTTSEVLGNLRTLDLRAATLFELLAFGLANKDLQLKFPITALGSPLRRRDGYNEHPELWDGFLERRELDLIQDIPYDTWDEHHRFLAFDL